MPTRTFCRFYANLICLAVSLSQLQRCQLGGRTQRIVRLLRRDGHADADSLHPGCVDGLNARLCILKAEAFRRLQVQRFGAIQENFRVGLGPRCSQTLR